MRALTVAAVVALAGVPIGGAIVDPDHGGLYLLAVIPVAAVVVFFAIVLHGEST